MIGWVGSHPKDGRKTKPYPRSFEIFSKIALGAMGHRESKRSSQKRDIMFPGHGSPG